MLIKFKKLRKSLVINKYKSVLTNHSSKVKFLFIIKSSSLINLITIIHV